MQQKKQYVITEDIKQKLLETVDIAALISSDIKLTRLSSNNMTACCPFHSENTPSFTVSTNKGFYHCFGCGAHGNAISWVMSYKGLDYVEAILHLGEFANIEIPSITLDEKKNFQELVSFNKWVIGKAKKQTEIDHSALLPFLQKLILLRPDKEEGADESFISDLISIKHINVRAANDYSKLKDIQEIVALAKTLDSIKGNRYGHFVRDRRGFVTGLAIHNPENKSGYQFTPLPLGKKLNESLLGIEQSQEKEDLAKKNVFLFANPEFYFLNRFVTKTSFCLSHPVNSFYFSREQLSLVTSFTNKKFGNDIFNGGIYLQVNNSPEDKDKIISTIKALHQNSELISKGGVFIGKDEVIPNLKPCDSITDSEQVVVYDFVDYILNFAKLELGLNSCEHLTAKQRFAVLQKIAEVFELNDDHPQFEQCIEMYANKLSIPADIFISAKDVQPTALIKNLIGNSLEELCFAIMCNRPHLAVEFHTQIESFMEKQNQNFEATETKIFSDFDVGSKIGAIFMASSVCAHAIEKLEPGMTSIVEISKQLEADISKEFAINFIQLGIRHRSVVEQLPPKCSPFSLIKGINELLNNFTQRINALSIYDRYVVLASMHEGKLPMSSFAALTMDVSNHLTSERSQSFERN